MANPPTAWCIATGSVPLCLAVRIAFHAWVHSRLIGGLRLYRIRSRSSRLPGGNDERDKQRRFVLVEE